MKFTFPPESKPLEGYTIKRAIHRGGFGEVYYALSDGGKEVALKLLQHNMDIELRGVSQCLNLKNPNLVSIFDIRTDADGDHWIVMEYVSGKSLDEVLSDQPGPMPVAEVEKWLDGMAAGLSFLHDRGIVHRDLKPANIYRESGVVKIGDVGLAKYISESRRSAQTESVGTVYYMAPEVARGRYGREVDIYSLGIMLYEMLTGDVPFDGESTAEILMKHLSQAPDLSPLPRPLRPVVAKALAKDPVHRTPTAAQLLDEFRQALAGAEVITDVGPESIIGQTVADSSVALREQAENYDELVLRLPKGSGKKLRRAAQKARKEFQKVAYHAGIEARKAAEQARREARKAVKFARRHGYWQDDPWAAGYAAGQNGHLRNGNFTQPVGDYAAQSHRSGWRKFPWIPIAGICFLVLFVHAPLATLSGVIRLSILGAIGYGGYRLVKSLAGSDVVRSAYAGTAPLGAPPVAQQRPPAAAQPVVVPVSAPVAEPVQVRHPHRFTHLRAFNPATPRAIARRARMTDLTGSMTLAAFLTLLMTVGVMLLASPIFKTTALAGMFGLTTLLGAWSLIALAKMFEGRPLDTGAMRLMQLAAGVAVGTAAFWMNSVLMTDLSTNRDMVDAVFNDVGSYRLIDQSPATPHGYWTNDGWTHERSARKLYPSLAGYMVFFGALFGARRWWWMCDSFRKRRLRVMSVVWTAGLALILTFIWAFPKDWAMMWAVALACIVQLSSGWTRREDRLPLVEGASHGV